MKWLMRRMHRPIYQERLRRLVDALLVDVRPGDRLLDVGCGNGTLLHTLAQDPRCPAGVTVHGIERIPRGGEPIPVTAYPGGRMPFDDASFDLVIVADVLHHDGNEHILLAECARVAARAVIVKDHAREGPFAQARISLLDWAANTMYGVTCLYRYHSVAEWHEVAARAGLRVARQVHPMKLYPRGWELVFGGRLQYFAVLTKR
ncbi:MAG: class I SAM-dependent methyltransferase [Phycisphaerae bacterium]|nr:class I SAM-dependent methyltransferase [Phycisphaerae bacterium]